MLQLKNGIALRYASDRLKDNGDIIKLVVEKNGIALQYASDRLKDNDNIVKLAVEKNGIALQYASDRLKDNDDILRIAVKNADTGIGILDLSPKYKNYKNHEARWKFEKSLEH